MIEADPDRWLYPHLRYPPFLVVVATLQPGVTPRLRSRRGPHPTTHGTAIGSFPAILGDLVRMIVAMVERRSVQFMLEPVPAPPNEHEHQHPATPQLKRAPIPPERVENVSTFSVDILV